jgi:hypothetical protein
MNSPKLCLWIAAVIAPLVFGAGCGRKESDSSGGSASKGELPVHEGVSYSPKQGLLIAPLTAKFIGLTTIDVAERSVEVTREISGRVFRAATVHQPHALASAILPVEEAAALHPGLKAGANPNPGEIEVLRLEPGGDQHSGMAEVILQVKGAPPSLREGSLVTARFVVGATNPVTAVPAAALLRTLQGDFVYVVNGNHFIRASVKVGRMNGEHAEVLDGLYVGDQVVLHPVMTLWMTELHHVNGGDACCIPREPKK